MPATQTVLDNIAKLRAALPETVAEIERQAVAKVAKVDPIADELLAACSEHGIYSRLDLEARVTSLRALAAEITNDWTTRQ